ncbi:MAG: TerC/Alx family metal homeostasis membrane protein [bacterium]
MMNEWVVFHLGVAALLFLDLVVLNRKEHVIEFKEALKWSAFWISLGLGFGFYIYLSRGIDSALEYYAAYIIEESLSVDNLMVFAVIFASFNIERKHQHRLLFWGIMGAIIMRAIMITAGTQLIQQFHFIMYIFGAILLFTGIKFLLSKGENHFDPRASKVFHLAKKFLPITDEPHNGHFFKYDPHSKHHSFTLYFIALLIVESTDVLFAIDSVPAVLAISRDTFVVYTSNIAAVMGLRALFFVLEDLIKRFHLLQPALGLVLSFVGIKMLIEKWYVIPVGVNLAIVLGILISAGILSKMLPQKTKH